MRTPQEDNEIASLVQSILVNTKNNSKRMAEVVAVAEKYARAQLVVSQLGIRLANVIRQVAANQGHLDIEKGLLNVAGVFFEMERSREDWELLPEMRSLLEETEIASLTQSILVNMKNNSKRMAEVVAAAEKYARAQLIVSQLGFKLANLIRQVAANQSHVDIEKGLLNVAGVVFEMERSKEDWARTTLSSFVVQVKDLVNAEREQLPEFARQLQKQKRKAEHKVHKAEEAARVATGKKKPEVLQEALFGVSSAMTEAQNLSFDQLRLAVLVERKKYCGFVGAFTESFRALDSNCDITLAQVRACTMSLEQLCKTVNKVPDDMEKFVTQRKRTLLNIRDHAEVWRTVAHDEGITLEDLSDPERARRALVTVENAAIRRCVIPPWSVEALAKSLSPNGYCPTESSESSMLSSEESQRDSHLGPRTLTDSLGAITPEYAALEIPQTPLPKLSEGEGEVQEVSSPKGISEAPAAHAHEEGADRGENQSLATRHKVCLKCRKPGHTLAECTENAGDVSVCYNCGDPTHSLKDCPVPRTGSLKFVKCFVCGEVGHLSSACEKNPKGIYPKGGCCRMCGSVYHLKADCPVKNKGAAAAPCGLLRTREQQKTMSADADDTYEAPDEAEERRSQPAAAEGFKRPAPAGAGSDASAGAGVAPAQKRQRKVVLFK
eukprot:m51a1_g5683 putative zinc finger protein containing cchc type domain containing protein (665) ;mRNA; f:976202-981293